MTVQPLVLVVDDDTSTRIALTHLLEMEGYAVATAENGAEALETVARVRPSLVLSDVRMPVMDGEALVAELEARGGPPVVLLTALALITEERAAEIGAAGMIHKPVDLDELTALLGKILASAEAAAGP